MNSIINYFRRNRFCLNIMSSPTYFNVSKHLINQGFRNTDKAWCASLNEMHFLFNSDVAECLEYKDKLAQLVAQYCPEVMPLTYCIDDMNWPTIVSHISNTLCAGVEGSQPNSWVWILKPATLNNGQHIKIFNQFNQIEAHFLSTNRLGGPHVLQQYITQPHLLKGPVMGHKYSIRMFVVVTNYAGAYLYPHGYFNIAKHPYHHHEFNDVRPHLTNEHLTTDESNVMQIPTQRYDLFLLFYPQIKVILTKVMSGLRDLYPTAFESHLNRSVALVGFDFMVDTNERVWLMEANHGPCFPIQADHPLQPSLYHDFWQALISSFIIPIANDVPVDGIQYGLFERL